MKENKRCAFIKIKQPEESEEGHLRMNRRINENIFDAVKTSEGLEENPFGKLSSVPRKLKMFNNLLDHKKLVNFHKLILDKYENDLENHKTDEDIK